MSDSVRLSFNAESINGRVHPVSSKSESNRALVIRFLSGNLRPIDNLAACDDTYLMQQNLENMHKTGQIITMHCGHAGTVMRFLTACCSCTEGEYELTGSPRLLERPVGELVNALRDCGADISYSGKEGYPPLRIHGKKLPGGKVKISAGISSQFISALMMCAPKFEHGVEILLEGEQVSVPYIEMTMRMMRYFETTVEMHGPHITVEPGAYTHHPFSTESDWSAASYYYSFLAQSENSSLFLKGYRKQSWQGDSVVEKIYRDFGIETTHAHDGIQLKRTAVVVPDYFQYDFTHCPDIAQTLAVTCALSGVGARLTGLKTLRIKETDRIAALCHELGKILEVSPQTDGDDLIIHPSALTTEIPAIETYDDHRMAMSFAPVVMRTRRIEIENPEVVFKSYPEFWNDIRTLGISVE